MQKLAVGDKVKVLSHPQDWFVGMTGVIKHIDDGLPFPVYVEVEQTMQYFMLTELEKLPSRAPGTPGINTTKGDHQTTQATPDHG